MAARIIILSLLALTAGGVFSLPTAANKSSSLYARNVTDQVRSAVAAGSTDVSALDVEVSAQNLASAAKKRSVDNIHHVRTPTGGHAAGAAEEEDEDRQEITEAEWQRQVRNGAQFYQWMSIINTGTLDAAIEGSGRLKNGQSPQSPFTDYPHDLQDNGWEEDPVDPKKYTFSDQIPIKSVLRDLGISTTTATKSKAGDNIVVNWRQGARLFNNKVHRFATNAEYLNIYNPKSGAIVVLSNYSPNNRLRDQLEQMFDHNERRVNQALQTLPDPIPQLHQLSDVVFLEWTNQAQKSHVSTTNLKYLIHHRCSNTETVEVIDQILKACGTKEVDNPDWEDPKYSAPPWKNRITLRPGTAEFAAALGSVNGASVAWMLVQRREKLGAKRVKKIYLYKDDGKNSPWPSLAFVLEDVAGGSRQPASNPPQAGSSKSGRQRRLALGKTIHQRDVADGNSGHDIRSFGSMDEVASLENRATGASESSDDDMDIDEEVADGDSDVAMEDAESQTEQYTPVNQEQFETYAQKGSAFYDWMTETNVDRLTTKMRQAGKISAAESSQSKFTDARAFTENGWSATQLFSDQLAQHSLSDVLKEYGLHLTLKTQQNPNGEFVLTQWKQDKTHFNGKDHVYATGGEYGNYYNTKKGAIISHFNYAPSYMLKQVLQDDGASKKEIEEMTKSGKLAVPELSRLSDVQYLDYAMAAGVNRDDLKSLKTIFWPVCKTFETNQVIDYILKSKGFEETHTPASHYIAPPWSKKITLLPGTPDFNAVLGTVNGAASSYLLAQHKEQFGVKFIAKVHIFQDSEYEAKPSEGYKGPSMVFDIENTNAAGRVPAGSDRVLRKPKAGSSKSGSKKPGSSKPGSSRGRISSGHRRDITGLNGTTADLELQRGDVALHKRAPQDPRGCEVRGRILMSTLRMNYGGALDRQLHNHGLLVRPQTAKSSLDYSMLENTASGWEREVNEHLDFANEPSIRDATTLRDAAGHRLSVNPRDYAYITWDHDNDYEHDGQQHSATFASIAAAYRPQQGVIMSTVANSPSVMISGSQDHDDDQPPPHVHHISDIYALEYSHQAAAQGVSPKKLQYFFVGYPDEITSEVMEEVLKIKNAGTRVLDPKGNQITAPPHWPGLKLLPRDDEKGFYAMMGTPRGSAMAMMLLQHRDLLGKKTVKSVTLFATSLWRSGMSYSPGHEGAILFEIEDI